jgi:hypothetical protein
MFAAVTSESKVTGSKMTAKGWHQKKHKRVSKNKKEFDAGQYKWVCKKTKKKLTHKVVWDDTEAAVELYSDGMYEGWYDGEHTKKYKTLKEAKSAALKLKGEINRSIRHMFKL